MTDAASKPLRTDRQRELLRVIRESFDRFATRGQHYYKLEGMATDSIVKHAVQDFTTLRAFWPQALRHPSWIGNGGETFELHEDTLEKVQNAVRETLDQLVDYGYVLKVGNEHERRWRLT
jgi:hypothetical protein